MGFGLLEGPTLTLMQSDPAHVSARRSASCMQHTFGPEKVLLTSQEPSTLLGRHNHLFMPLGISYGLLQYWQPASTGKLELR